MKGSSRSGMTAWLDGLFGIDTRALAVLRVGLALLVLFDLGQRFGDLRAFHTDQGVLTRAALLAKSSDPSRLSLHLIGGTEVFAAAMLALAAVFAGLMLIGWRTRLSTFVTWLLFASLSARNPLVIQGGDALLRMMLFWSIFLPLGARGSADRALDTSGSAPGRRVLSAGSAALLVQVAMVYVFTALLKTGPEWRIERSAIYYALSIDQFVTPFGLWLLERREWLPALTAMTLWLERLGPLFLLWPFKPSWLRTLAVAVFLGFHTVMGMSLRLGIFPFVDALALVLFLPTAFWDGLGARLRRPSGLTLFYDADCGFCKRSVHLLREWLLLSGARVVPAQSDAAASERMQASRSWVVRDERGREHTEFDAFLVMAERSVWARWLAPAGRLAPVRAAGTWAYRWVASHRSDVSRPTGWLAPRPVRWKDPFIVQALAAFLLGCAFLWNLGTLGPPFAYPRGVKFVKTLYLDQWWSMFAPWPMKLDGWFVVPARLKDGGEVDLWSGAAPVDWGKPEDLSGTFKNHRWTKYINNLGMKRYRKYLPDFADYLCRRWSDRHAGDPSKRIEGFEVYFMAEPTPAGHATGPVEKRLMLKHVCRGSKKHSNTMVSKRKSGAA